MTLVARQPSLLYEDPEGSVKDFTIEALKESIELMRVQLTRYRRVASYLRRENSRLRQLKNIQYQNDLEFKALCQSDIYIDVDVTTGNGGLPNSDAS
jgi:hypothetical protein